MPEIGIPVKRHICQTRTYSLCTAVGILFILGCQGRTDPRVDQPCFILSASDGLCWDVRSQDVYSDLPSAKIQQYNCNGGVTQVFTFTRPTTSPVRGLRLVLTEFAAEQKGYVDAVPASTEHSSGVYAYKDPMGVHWAIQPGPGNNVYIVQVPSHQCVDRPNGSSNPGDQLRLSPCNGGTSQQWTLQPVTDAKLLSKLKAKNSK